MEIHQRLLSAFRQRFGGDPAYIARAPGRVNLLGEHVDYNDGFVLPAALDRYTQVAFRRSESPRTHLFALDLGKEVSFDIHSVKGKKDSDGLSLPVWARYPAGVMWSLDSLGLATPAFDAVYSSTVPSGAGLSSSASVELAFGVAWKKLGTWPLSPIKLAQACLKAEVEYVGLKCGIMDQFASACGVKDRLLFLDCRSLEWRTVRLPDNTAIVIADTTLRRSLPDSAYNDRYESCAEAVRLLREYLPKITSLRDVRPGQFRRYSGRLPVLVAQRARHVIEEIARTEQAVELLETNDAVHFGELMNHCHASLRDLYEVSSPELDKMVAFAQSLPGCFGARLTGAGFGGCTVNLVAADAAETFARQLADGYSHATGLLPEVYICHAADGARVETL